MSNAEIFHKGRWQAHHFVAAGIPLQEFRDTELVRGPQTGPPMEGADERIAVAMGRAMTRQMVNIFSFLEHGNGETFGENGEHTIMRGWRAWGEKNAPDPRRCEIHYTKMLEWVWVWRWDYEAMELRLESKLGLNILEDE